jgi:non-ribosomal peptide synthetase component F
MIPLISEYVSDNNMYHLLDSVKHVSLGGELADKKIMMLIKKIFQCIIRITNSYGPAECTITSTAYTFSPHQIESLDDNIPIGKPLKNYKIYIMNDVLKQVSIGQIGELYIGGYSVMDGYINEEQHKGSIIYHPSTGEKLYKTGDLVKINKEGLLIFIGRASNSQVKLRGQRLELSEIESVCLKHPFIKKVYIKKIEKNKEK